MTTSHPRKIGIIGAGKFGTALGKLAVEAGYSVYIAGSKTAEAIKLTIDILVPGAIASSVEEISQVADLIMLALPLSKYQQLNPLMFEDKILVDSMNYWWEVDGLDNVFSDEIQSSSERVQSYFSMSKVVKAFNHIGYHNLTEDAKPKSNQERNVVLFASDHENLIPILEGLIENLGFAPMFIGALKYGRILETGWPLFGASLPREAIEMLVHDSRKCLIVE